MALHPKIWGSLQAKERNARCAKVLGIEVGAVYNWFLTGGKKCMVPAWYDLVRSMTWADVKKFLHPDLINPFQLSDNSTVHEQLTFRSYHLLTLEEKVEE